MKSEQTAFSDLSGLTTSVFSEIVAEVLKTLGNYSKDAKAKLTLKDEEGNEVGTVDQLLTTISESFGNLVAKTKTLVNDLDKAAQDLPESE